MTGVTQSNSENPGKTTELAVPRTRRAVLAFLRVVVLLVIIAAVAFPFVVKYDRDARAAMLQSAGPIETQPMATSLSLDSVAPPATESGNAAPCYLAAVNSWNSRRLPYLKNRKLNPFADEPAPTPQELDLLSQGARRKECNFYNQSTGPTALVFEIYPGPKLWLFEPTIDPFEMRPYTNIFRLLAQGALNTGKKLEKSGKLPEAERLYQVVARFGEHLQQAPGSIIDIQLGLELQQKALHYLDVFYVAAKNPSKRQRVWRYGDALTRLQERVQHKFTQIGNPEAAIYVLKHDQEPVWKIQSASALTVALDDDEYGWWERRAIRGALSAARQDSDINVRRAAILLAARKPTPSAVSPSKVEEEAGH